MILCISFSAMAGWDEPRSLAQIDYVCNIIPGAIPLGSTGGCLTTDATKLFWDNTNNRLGVGTNTPGSSFSVFDYHINVDAVGYASNIGLYISTGSTPVTGEKAALNVGTQIPDSTTSTFSDRVSALYASIGFNSTQTLTSEFVGVISYPYVAATATGQVDNMFAVFARPKNLSTAGGTVTKMFSFISAPQAAGNVGTLYGLRLTEATGAGEVGKTYGVHQLGTNTENYFEGQVNLEGETADNYYTVGGPYNKNQPGSGESSQGAAFVAYVKGTTDNGVNWVKAPTCMFGGAKYGDYLDPDNESEWQGAFVVRPYYNGAYYSGLYIRYNVGVFYGSWTADYIDTDAVMGTNNSTAANSAIYASDGIRLEKTADAYEIDLKYPVYDPTTDISGNLGTLYSTANVSNPPTDAELDAIYGTPAAMGAGFSFHLDDAGGGINFYYVVSDGTNWFYFTGTKAI